MSQCLAREHDNRCDRFDEHPGPHVRFTDSGDTVSWFDPVPCQNCGELIAQMPNDYLRRWRHIESIDDSTDCRLTAQP